ncbi:MAG: hypothetical protein PUC32_07785 [Oscillospiraceae bacterium]|nr:hypothetical protein [Oscillospiraceae bacterium]
MELKKTEELCRLAFAGQFGLERETLRVDSDGYLSQTPHPFPGNPHIDRDFCESQIEIISPVCRSISELYRAVEDIDRETKAGLNALNPPEMVWPFSNPPYVVSEEQIPVAKYEGELHHKEVYRNYLAEKYGKRKMLFCGIHFNYSYSDAFIAGQMAACGVSDEKLFKNFLYLSLSEKIELYSWLPVFLTSASPVYDESFVPGGTCGEDGFCGEASMRNGDNGYWNSFVPIIDYSDMEHYTDSIQRYVDSGQLYSASEWYTPVRIKPRGENSLSSLRERGANHIELRMMDINPLSHVGVLKDDLYFLHLFLVYLTFCKKEPFGEREQIDAVESHKQSALYDASQAQVTLHGKKQPLDQAALAFLEEMEAFFLEIGRQDVLPVLKIMKNRCTTPSLRHSHRVYDRFHKHFVTEGMKLAKDYMAPDAQDLIDKL